MGKEGRCGEGGEGAGCREGGEVWGGIMQVPELLSPPQAFLSVPGYYPVDEKCSVLTIPFWEQFLVMPTTTIVHSFILIAFGSVGAYIGGGTSPHPLPAPVL